MMIIFGSCQCLKHICLTIWKFQLLWTAGSLSSYFPKFLLVFIPCYISIFCFSQNLCWCCNSTQFKSDEYTVWLYYLDRVLKIKLGEQSKVVFNCLVLWPIVLLSSCLSVSLRLYQNWPRFVVTKRDYLYYCFLDRNGTILYGYCLMIYSYHFVIIAGFNRHTP